MDYFNDVLLPFWALKVVITFVILYYISFVFWRWTYCICTWYV